MWIEFTVLATATVLCLVPGPVLEARDGAVSKMETSPCPHGIHFLVKGGGNKVVNDSSTRLSTPGVRLPSPGKSLSECVCACACHGTMVPGSVCRVLWRLPEREHGVGG